MEPKYKVVLTLREEFNVIDVQTFTESQDNFKKALQMGKKWAKQNPSIYNFNVRFLPINDSGMNPAT